MFIHVDSKQKFKSGMIIHKERYADYELILPEIKTLLDADFYSHLINLAADGLGLWGFAALTLQKGGADIVFRMRELAFELCRWKHYPDRPSRLQCLFAWIDADNARKYKKHYGGRLFEVSVIGDMPDFIADENVFNNSDADLYWQGSALSNAKDYIPAKECLLSPPIKVLREINE